MGLTCERLLCVAMQTERSALVPLPSSGPNTFLQSTADKALVQRESNVQGLQVGPARWVIHTHIAPAWAQGHSVVVAGWVPGWAQLLPLPAVRALPPAAANSGAALGGQLAWL